LSQRAVLWKLELHVLREKEIQGALPREDANSGSRSDVASNAAPEAAWKNGPKERRDKETKVAVYLKKGEGTKPRPGPGRREDGQELDEHHNSP